MKERIIISGGGTGGHIYPAIAIARAIKEISPDSEILFVGAEGKIEMEKVPAAGFRIIGLPVRGFVRKVSVKNVAIAVKLLRSLYRARDIMRTFKPDLVLGVGGYASGPMMRTAIKMGIPCAIQEQNSFPGMTNRMVAKHTEKIFVAFNNMDRYFPEEKICLTGNPVRQDLTELNASREEAVRHFGLEPHKPVILLLGGSGGAKQMNFSIINKLPMLSQLTDIQLIWQTGKAYHEWAMQSIGDIKPPHICVFPFIERMDMAYRAANVVISRAGAGTIAELCLTSRPAILVPSPNVAGDHQMKNCLDLTSCGAALLIPDDEAPERLLSEAVALARDTSRQNALAQEIGKMARPDAANHIARELLELISIKKQSKEQAP